MNQSLRNLHRVTTPEFLPDGTPMVNIPSHILLEGLDNQKEYIVGQFMRCSAPSGGLIHAIMSKIWGRRCKIFTRKITDSSYLFHIPDEPTRKWVLQRGFWHIDDCLMFVSPWSPAANITLPEITTLPIWLTLKNRPFHLYSIEGIKWISSGIGEPMLTSKPRLDPTLMGEAKILVEVKLDRPFSQRVAVKDDSGTISMVEVLYFWLPPKCTTCGHLGHKSSRCLEIPASKHSTKTTEGVRVSNKKQGSSPALPTSDIHLNVTNASLDALIQVQSSTVTLQTITADAAALQIISEQQTASEATLPPPTISLADQLHTASPTADSLVQCSTPNTKSDHKLVILGSESVAQDRCGVEEMESSSEDSIDENRALEETLQRKSTRPSKPTMKAKEMQRSGNKGRRGKGRRGRGHR